MEAEDWEDLLREKLDSVSSDFEELVRESQPARRRASTRGNLRRLSRDLDAHDLDDDDDMGDVISRAQRVREHISQLMDLHEGVASRPVRPRVRPEKPSRVSRQAPQSNDKLKRAVLLLILSELL